MFQGCNPKDSQLKSLVRANYIDSIQAKEIKILDSLQLVRFNDSAKWLLYTIHCDDSCLMGRARNRQLLNKIPLSFLPLKLGYVSKDGDSLSLLYDFIYDNDSIRIETLTTPNTSLTSGVVFDIKSDTVIGYIKGEAIYNETGQYSRYQLPLKQEVKTFLKHNQSKLDPWLREEAKRRKVIP